jgi:hypothetical protein
MPSYSQNGLAGMPSSLQHLRDEVGLAGEPWQSLGAKWQALAAKWLRTKTALGKSGNTELTFNEIRQSTIPDDWKDWVWSKIIKIDAKPPSDSFGKVFTDYLRGLPTSSMKVGGTVMAEVWARPGKTGVIGLLLCLYWQAEYSGAGKDWNDNIKHIDSIFNAILAIPEL